jgi:uncharacterized OsmC-like protein
MSAERTENLNGVDTKAVARIADGYRADPSSGRKRFDARVEWLGGYRTQARLGPYRGVAGDEPEELAGSATGPSPEEMLLGAVGQCLIVGLAGSASARGIRLDRLAVEVEGRANLAAAYAVDQGNPGFDAIEVRVHIDADADRERLEDLVQHALKLAPIPDTVSRPVPVEAILA